MAAAEMQIVQGLGVADGIAIGRAVCLVTRAVDVYRFPIPEEQIETEVARLREAVRRTEGASAAFIKELMRRLAQSSIIRTGGASIASRDIGEALDDMLFAGGKLNVRLLGGTRPMQA